MIPSGPTLRFLVVDDDDDVRHALVRTVRHLGHDADSASDGVEAIATLAVETYDYLLLDLAMPRMPGEDVMRWIRDHRRWTGDIRVVVVTGLPAHDRRRINQLGAHAVLHKPLRLQQLRDLVDGSGSGEDAALSRPA